MENRTDEITEGSANHTAADRPTLPGEPEQPKLAGAHNLKGHTHPRTYFGRLVDGCAGCEIIAKRPKLTQKTRRQIVEYVQVQAAAPPAQAAPPPAAESVTMTFEQLQTLLAARDAAPNADLTEALKAFAIELKKPDAEEQAKKDTEKARADERKRLRIIEIRTEEEQKHLRWANCNHTKENGKTAVNIGQIFSDNMHHPFCCRCFRVFPALSPAPGTLTGAIS